MVPPRSASTVKTSTLASFGRMSPLGTLQGTEWWMRVTIKSGAAFVRAITPDGAIVCELFEGRVHAEFGPLHTCRQYPVTVKEVLQFYLAVVNAIAVELQESAPLKGRSCCERARLRRRDGSDREGLMGEEVLRRESRTCSLHIRGLLLSGCHCRWDRGGTCWTVSGTSRR